jgi:1-acyl-sn-glycerol-3-phosphate acyltransferase
MINSLLVFVTILVLSLPSAVVFIPLAALTGDIRPLYKVTCLIVSAGYWVAGIRIKVAGREKVPAGRACIFMANHVSNLDPPALISHIPGRTSAFAKRSIFKLPLFGICLRLAEYIPVDRTGNVITAKASVAEAARLLANGLHITTFVEGSRSRDGRMQPFKKGPFYLAMLSGAPCIPVSIYGTETMMARGSFAIKPGTAHFIFHAPLYPRDYASREELSQAVRAVIASGLPEWMRN